MEKLKLTGVGPKIAGIALPWLVLTIILTLKYKPVFNMGPEESRLLKYIGALLAFAGFMLYLMTVRALIRGVRETSLVTDGGFYFCSNPLYASILLFMIPGLALLMNSWIILTSSVAGYILFKIYIKEEKQEMEKFFGKRYLDYLNETPEFFPFPVKKWLKKN